MEDDHQYPISTSNSMLLGRLTATLGEYPDEDVKGNWKRRQRYVANMQPGKDGKQITLTLDNNDTIW